MITCQEEVFAYFKTLSGSRRIEIMCGLMSMCIPLEIRFLEAVIQDLAKKSFGTFRDAEIKANSRQELENVCKCDLLLEKAISDHEDVEMNGNGDGSAGTLVSGIEPIQKMILTKYPSRSKLIISMCLLQSTNHQCATIAYNFISKQLTTDALINAVYNVYIPKNYPVEVLFNEILLLLSLAIYHPAFTYEERDLMIKQKEDVERVLAGVHTYYLQTALQQTAAAVAAIQQPPPLSQAPAPANALGATSGPPPQGGQPTYPTTGLVQHNPAHTQHPQAQSQPVHAYHQYGGPQHPAVVSTTGKALPQSQAHLAPGMHPQATFPISFIQSSVPIANLTYTPQPPTPQSAVATAQVANQTNAVMQNLSILRINSPPSITSTSPSPTISPSPAKMAAGPPPLSVPNQQPVGIKLDSSMYTTATGLPPNSQLILPFVGDSGVTSGPGTSAVAQAIPYMSLPPGQPIIVEDMQKTSSSVSSSSSIPSSVSCYNCGGAGHRGTECTSGGDEIR